MMCIFPFIGEHGGSKQRKVIPSNPVFMRVLEGESAFQAHVKPIDSVILPQ
jgi:hypothetical protein